MSVHCMSIFTGVHVERIHSIKTCDLYKQWFEKLVMQQLSVSSNNNINNNNICTVQDGPELDKCLWQHRRYRQE